MKYLILCLSFFFSVQLFSQDTGSIRGRVFDLEAGEEALMFARVILKGTELEAQSNLHGNFEIADLAPGSYLVEISYLGYEKRDIPVTVISDHVAVVEAGLQTKKLASVTLANLSEESELSAQSLE